MKNYNIIPMKTIVLKYLLIATISILASCNTNTENASIQIAAEEPADENTYELSVNQFSASNMQLGPLENKTFHTMIKSNGMFDVPPAYKATVSTYFGGTVKSVLLLPGQYVKKGQLLFVLENPDYVAIQQDYLEAKGELSFLKSDYERQLNLVQDQVSSQKKYLKASSEYEVMSVKVAALAKKLALMGINVNQLSAENIRTTITVTAPINGYVTAVNISNGTFLTPTQTAITIIDATKIHLELNIFEKDLSKVNKGQSIVFTLQNDKTKTYKARVELINKTIDLENRTVGIHAHLVDEKQTTHFTPGMYVEANILTTADTSISLPQNALVEVEGKYYVLELTNKTAEGYSFIKKEVQTGISNDDFVEILNANEFKENTQFLINGAFNLISE